MDIYFDNIIFPLQQHGGISVVWYELLKRALDDSDFECKFIDITNDNFLRKKIHIPPSSILNNNISNYPIKIQRYINPKINSGKGIFHSSYYRIVKDPNIVNITSVHDFTYEHFVNGVPKLIHHQQKGNAIKNSKKIICVSENTKIDLLKFYPKVKEDVLEVIYNGVSDDYFPILSCDSEQLNQLITFQKNEFVLYVGDRRSSYKNFGILVDACSIVNVPLVIVGGGVLTKLEDSMLEIKLGRTNFQQLCGISNSDLNILYNNAFFFGYPSLYEGFGIPIIEAQRAGCPVICSNQSSIPEVAGNGAFIIEDISAQKIADIFCTHKSCSNQLNSIIEAGYKNAQRFSWDNTYQQIKLVYSDLYARYF